MASPSSKRRKIDHLGRAHTASGRASTSRDAFVPHTTSDLFELQVEELLSEVRPRRSKRLERVDAALRKLKSKIESIPAHDPLSVRRRRLRS